MTFFPRALLIGLSALALSAPVAAQRADNQIAVQSVTFQKDAKALIAEGKFEAAQGMLETALAIDPRNRGAYIDLARVAIGQKLFGKAIRMTNKAMLLEPNDPEAIAVQGEAMVELGALARAKANLAKLQEVCAKGCPQVAELSARISKGPSSPQSTAANDNEKKSD